MNVKSVSTSLNVARQLATWGRCVNFVILSHLPPIVFKLKVEQRSENPGEIDSERTWIERCVSIVGIWMRMHCKNTANNVTQKGYYGLASPATGMFDVCSVSQTHMILVAKSLQRNRNEWPNYLSHMLPILCSVKRVSAYKPWYI